MPTLGSKHKCHKCQTKFYDMGAAKIVCPVCAYEVKKTTPIYSVSSLPIFNESEINQPDTVTEDNILDEVVSR